MLRHLRQGSSQQDTVPNEISTNLNHLRGSSYVASDKIDITFSLRKHLPGWVALNTKLIRFPQNLEVRRQTLVS